MDQVSDQCRIQLPIDRQLETIFPDDKLCEFGLIGFNDERTPWRKSEVFFVGPDASHIPCAAVDGGNVPGDFAFRMDHRKIKDS